MKQNIIELPVSELREALPGLGKIISRKNILPVLSAVRVARDKSGILSRADWAGAAAACRGPWKRSGRPCEERPRAPPPVATVLLKNRVS